jgi:hypothetical protein
LADAHELEIQPAKNISEIVAALCSASLIEAPLLRRRST